LKNKESNISKLKKIQFKKQKTKIQYVKQNIIAKINLKNNIKMNKYVSKFEKLIPKLSDEKLNKLNEKISKLSDNTRNHKKYKDILNFIEAKV
jgi:hypothetical protein